MSADPGCGKSVLARYLIDEVLQHDGRIICYFFFKDDQLDQRSAANALCAILRQIFAVNLELFTELILNKFERGGERLFTSFGDLWEIFLDVTWYRPDRLDKEVICILDALDECDDSDRETLIQAITNIGFDNSRSAQRLRFIATSRPYDHITRGFRCLERQIPTIHLSGESEEEVDEISNEIGLVIRSRVAELALDKNLLSDEETYLAEQLLAVPHRTYLWVTLVMETIREMPGFTRYQVRQEITTLPRTVDDAYEKILRRSKNVRKARKLLMLLVVTLRPLSLQEVSIALAVEDDIKSCSDINDRLEPLSRFRDTLRNLCGLFVTTVGSNVYLLHQTAKEFLIRSDSLGPKSVQPSLNDFTEHQTWGHSISLIDANKVLASICLTYLGLYRADSSQSGLFDYAERYWLSYTCAAQPDAQERMVQLAEELLDWKSTETTGATSKRTKAEVECFENLNAILDSLPKIYLPGLIKSSSRDTIAIEHDSGIIRATVLGLPALVRRQINQGKSVETKDQRGLTLLHVAAFQGHVKIVKILLSYGATIDAKDDLGNTPLMAAVSSNVPFLGEGYPNTAIELLLSKGADIEAADNAGFTPLHRAIEYRKFRVIKYLLKHHAHVNAKDNRGQSPLLTTISKCCKNKSSSFLDIPEFLLEIAEELLARGAQVDLSDKDGRTPLWWAVASGEEKATKLLLKHGALPNDADSSGKSPLMKAVQEGHVTQFELLMQHGAQIEQRDREGATAPWLAASYGRLALAQLLLDSGADFDAKDYNGVSSLAAAARNRETRIVQLLLEQGASVSMADNDGKTALWWAVVYGHALVELLLNSGADVNARDRDGASPLAEAVKRGSIEVVKLLIERGADIHQADVGGATVNVAGCILG